MHNTLETQAGSQALCRTRTDDPLLTMEVSGHTRVRARFWGDAGLLQIGPV
jgi:hypothetical protein